MSLLLMNIPLRITETKRGGLRAISFEPVVPKQDHHRNLEQISKIISQSKISERAKKTAIAIFDKLAQAEAAVHGKAPKDIHFHEIGALDSIVDIVYVRPDTFKPEATRAVAREIARINGELQKNKRPYLLIGPGRWGSADPWLGIPVQWQDISGVAAMIELQSKSLKADPSQGTHFFQNITAMDIKYFTVIDDPDHHGAQQSYLDWQWLLDQPLLNKTDFLGHVRLAEPFIIQVNSRQSLGIMFEKT